MYKRISALFLAVWMSLTMLPAQALAWAACPEQTLPPEAAPPAEHVSWAEDGPAAEELPEAAPAAGAASSGTCGEDVTWVLDEGGTLTISGTGPMRFTSMFGSAPWPTSLKSVIITPGVTSIYSRAFENCSSLTSISIPDSVEQIGYRAFHYCTHLESICIPGGMEALDYEVFANSGLTSITIPNGIKTIGSGAFRYCRKLTSVTIPSSVETIRDYAFEGCENLPGITIPDSVTVIELGAFKGCKKLSSVTLPNEVTTIDGIFENCISLESMVIPASVSAVGRFAFSGCENLTSVTIPNTVTSINEAAFKGCSNLESIDIPAGVTSIAASAFENCVKLKNITLPNGLDAINYRTFYRCSSLTDITIPDSVLGIGGSAFSFCQSLTGITIPSSVKSIGIEAFSRCNGLTRLTFPDSRVELDTMAFSNCDGLTSLTIPGEMTGTGVSAFSSCSALTSVTLEEGVRSIDDGTFSGCSALTEVNIPDSLVYIGNQAFSNCQKLAGSLDLPAGMFFIGSGAFSSCYSLTGSVTIPGTVKGNLGQSAFRDCRNLERVILEEGVTSIGKYTFRSCDRLVSIHIPNSVTSIDKDAFYWTNTLADIYYAGAKETWEALTAASKFIPPVKAKIHFDATGETALTVILDPKGGQLAPSDAKNITAVVNAPYGELPTPTRDGYIFRGWFTEPDQGEQVTAETVVSEEDAGRTLYARWTVDWLKKMTYRFGNSGSYFSYEAHYKIPYARYAAVFGDTPRAKELFEGSGEWGGNCFGMSTTSAMFSQIYNSISVGSFRSGASRPYDLEVSDTNGAWHLTLTEFIETLQISQSTQQINRHYWYGCSLEELCAQAKTFQQNGDAPPVVLIWGLLDQNKVGGHAMLVYDLADISPTESRLLVYDPNYPDQERYIRLDRSNGAYTGWYYHLNDTYSWGSAYPQAKIAYVPYLDFYRIWTDKPVAYSLPDRGAAPASPDGESALLIFNSDNAQILDAKGRQIATVEHGRLNTERTDIFPLLNVGVLPDGTAAGGENTILFLPPDQYTVRRNTDPGQPFDAVMVHVGQSAAVTTSGSSVTFAVNDGCALNYAKANGAEAGEYTITLESSLLERPEAAPGTFYSVTASGPLGEKGAAAAQIGDNLFAENVPAENIQVNGSPVSAEDIGDGAALDIPAVLDPNITAVLQEDGSVLLSKVPSGVVHVCAASYSPDGCMTALVTGTLAGSTVRFSTPVTEGASLFLLDEAYVPLSKKILIKKP